MSFERLSEKPKYGEILKDLCASVPSSHPCPKPEELNRRRFWLMAFCKASVCFCLQNTLLQETVRRECEERYELTAALTQAREQVLELKKLSGNFPLSPCSLTQGSLTSSAALLADYGQKSRTSPGAGKEINLSGQFGISRAAKAPTSSKRTSSVGLPTLTPLHPPRGRAASLNEPRSRIAAVMRRQLSQLWQLPIQHMGHHSSASNDHLLVHPWGQILANAIRAFCNFKLEFRIFFYAIMFLYPLHNNVITCYLHFKVRKVKKKKYRLSKNSTSSVGVIKIIANFRYCFPKPLCWNFPILCVLLCNLIAHFCVKMWFVRLESDFCHYLIE